MEDLLGEKHYDEWGHHNAEFDHRAFIGEEDDTFHEYSEEDASDRLITVFDEIDTNMDEYIDKNEMKARIKGNQLKRLEKESREKFKVLDVNEDSMLPWEEYKQVMFANDLAENNGKLSDSMQSMYTNDHRKFIDADQDNDGMLTLTEFAAFNFPHNFPHMQNALAMESLDTYDKNKDGKISWKEYISSMYNSEDNKEQPGWVRDEEKIYLLRHDKDGDELLDLSEIKSWIAPEENNDEEEEANHLIESADLDQDGKLTREELLSHQSLFAGHTKKSRKYEDPDFDFDYHADRYHDEL
ncbi:uncharacterized protein TRIADDRAFT_33976 [Trichoplax adhaerens]|uniref:Reticulocalbin-3 n=1 Tax=Trichoplax adhaerens TaxID=10228 RepID=B3SDI9_TRIAD|nr:hypothetical protein TRIADDRAFT_33976 [Trichoplax adhaerens]EDV19186.1 hypothetical protein TRIADDRAFT_33976 [Trichoplax adhaerens]|eukprot:XP_002118306.1 hypothetical protein TRIADDRAFT_33976 [Trichoplax adhaerens]